MFLLSGLPVQAQLFPSVNRGRGLHGNAALIERRCAALFAGSKQTGAPVNWDDTAVRHHFFKRVCTASARIWCDERAPSFERYRHLLTTRKLLQSGN